MTYSSMYIDFTLDYDYKCEDISTFEVDGQDLTDEVSYESVMNLVTKLKDVDGFILSDDRTNVQVYWKDGEMDILFRVFNEPDDGEFDDHELIGIEPIEFKWK